MFDNIIHVVRKSICNQAQVSLFPTQHIQRVLFWFLKSKSFFLVKKVANCFFFLCYYGVFMSSVLSKHIYLYIPKELYGNMLEKHSSEKPGPSETKIVQEWQLKNTEYAFKKYYLRI